MNDYFKQASYYTAANGIYTGQVVEVTMPRPWSYYAVGKPYALAVLNISNNYGDCTMALMLKDAIIAADAIVNFSQYAIQTKKGMEAPNVFLIHPGIGAEWNLDPNIICSHSLAYNGAYCYKRLGAS